MKRIDDLEFRWSNSNDMYEIIQWHKVVDEDKHYCIVIAFFRKKSEGCEIEFVGDRPFMVCNDELVWAMLKYGQAIVDAECELEWSTNDG